MKIWSSISGIKALVMLSYSFLFSLPFSTANSSLWMWQCICGRVTTHVGMCVVKAGFVTQLMSRCITPWPLLKQHPDPALQVSITHCHGDPCQWSVKINNRKVACAHDGRAGRFVSVSGIYLNSMLTQAVALLFIFVCVCIGEDMLLTWREISWITSHLG